MSNQLDRFIEAQNGVWDTVISELKAGQKKTHWIWFVFPQICGLGRSAEAYHFALVGYNEARLYYEHPLLGARLRECCEILLSLPETDPRKVMGSNIDAVKLRSSMTLFALATENKLFQAVLDKFFDGKLDEKTIDAYGLLDDWGDR